MLKKLTTLACLLVLILACGLTGAPARPSMQHSGVALEGIGIDTIRIGTSSKKDVIASYGEDFELIAHNKYSYEMSYKSGISFYYCYKDPAENIFLVELQPSSKVSTSKGIVVGESTMADVFNIYGEVDLSQTAYDGILVAQYRGVHFFIDTKRKRETEGFYTKNLDKLLPLKISEINIVAPRVRNNFCKEFEQTDEVERLKDL